MLYIKDIKDIHESHQGRNEYYYFNILFDYNNVPDQGKLSEQSLQYNAK
jgi:hypothetical protein